MTTFNEYWVLMHRTMLGLSHKIDLFTTWLAFFDSQDPCYSIIMSYPGTPYVYPKVSFNDPNNPDCVDHRIAYYWFYRDGVDMPGLSEGVEFHTYVYGDWDARLMGVQTSLYKGST